MGTALTIGNFDGVHLGHARLVGAARACAGVDGRVVVATFDPHPISVLRPHATPPRLSRIEQRRRWLDEAGADEVLVLEPTAGRLAQTPEAFLAWITEVTRPATIVEGPDFRFGRRRSGSIETLRALGARFGYETLVIDPVDAALDDQSVVRVTSSIIRWLIEHGRVADAARLLGRPYELEGTVVRGEQRGRELGWPTANLETGDMALPADGIYAGWAWRTDGRPERRYPAAISVGTKPTFGDCPRTCEAFLVDYDGPLDDYDWTMRLQVDRWVRDQIAFDGVEPLVAQLERDVEVVVRSRTLGRHAAGAPDA
jgi:riboflavin kinase/FMN adenylyltransferase